MSAEGARSFAEVARAELARFGAAAGLAPGVSEELMRDLLALELTVGVEAFACGWRTTELRPTLLAATLVRLVAAEDAPTTASGAHEPAAPAGAAPGVWVHAPLARWDGPARARFIEGQRRIRLPMAGQPLRLSGAFAPLRVERLSDGRVAVTEVLRERA